MKKALLGILVLVAGLTGSLQAQTVRGTVIDTENQTGLTAATVSLTSLKDTSKTKNVVTNENGSFLFNDVAKDSFLISVSFTGYATFSKKITLTTEQPSINLDTIYLLIQSTDLDEVVVVSEPAVRQKGDTTEFSASHYKVNADATVEDLVKKMPGITVDRDGTVTGQGEQVRKVTVDGKDFFGDDATAVLKNLPAELVDKIQLFDRLSEQAQLSGFDDGNSQKSINIVTKAGLKNGQYGRIYAGYGTDSRYAAGGNVSFFKGDRRISLVGMFNNTNQQNFGSQDVLGLTSSGGGRGGGGFGGGGNWGGGGGNFNVGQSAGISRTNSGGINFNDKLSEKLSISASYFINQSKNNNDRNSNTEYTSFRNEALPKYTSSAGITGTNNTNHRFNMRLEYKIDSFNSITLMPNVSIQNNSSSSITDEINLLSNRDTANTSNSRVQNDRDGYDIRNTVMYRRSFRKRGRSLTASFNTTFSKNNNLAYNYSLLRNFQTNIDSLLDQLKDNRSNGTTIGANINYTEPLGERSQLQFSYNPSFSKNSADNQTYQMESLSGKYDDFQPNFSNVFENNTATHRGGISYRWSQGRDKSFNIGVDYQHTTLESDRTFPTTYAAKQSFSNFLPNLMWNYKVSTRSSFRIMYRTSTSFPSINQLQDVYDNSNPFNMNVGNADLKQSFTNMLTGRYTFVNTTKGQSLFLNVFTQAVSNYITNGIYTAANDSLLANGVILQKGARITKPINMDGYKSIRTNVTYSMPIKPIKTNVNLSLGYSFSETPTFANNIESFTANSSLTGAVVFASNISEFIDFNLSYNASSGTAKNTTSNVKTNYLNQSVGTQFNLINKKGWFLQNDLVGQMNSGLAQGFNQNFWLWNVGIGKKIFKDKAGELKLSVFDLLKQNQSISRTIATDGSIIDAQSAVLQQYFMLTFTYNLKNFGKARTTGREGNWQRPEGGFPGGGFPGGGFPGGGRP